MRRHFFNKFLFGFHYAYNGLVVALKEQMNLKVQCGVAVLVVILGFHFDVTHYEWLALIVCIGLVISLEILNTAIEHLVNLVTLEWNAAAGKVKDISAGAVLVAAIASAMVGLKVFLPYVIREITLL